MIQLEDSYLQYTAKEKGVKKARIENHLDTQRNIATIGVLTIKDWMANSYLAGLKVSKEEDYQTYNRRTGEMTKPKTMYSVESMNGGYYEITKIAYDFYCYIEKLKATEKDMVNCINYEKELAKKKAIAEKEAEQLRRQQVEIEKQQRKEEFKRQKAEYIKKGMSVLQKYLPILQEELGKFLQNTDLNGTPEEYMQELKDRYAWEIGNPKLLKMSSERYCISDVKSTRPNDILFRNIYTRLLHIEPTDSGQTVSAKIRAFLDGREYKKTVPREAKLIKGYKRNKDTFYEIEGEPKKLFNETLILVQDEQARTWSLTDIITGLLMLGGSSKKEVLYKLKDLKEKKSEEYIFNVIKKGIERFGVAPNVYGTDGKYPYTRKDYVLELTVEDRAQELLNHQGIEIAVHALSKGISIGVDINTGVVLTVQPTTQQVKDELKQYIDKDTYERLVNYKKTGKI